MNNTQIIQKLQSSNSRLFKEEVLLNEMKKSNVHFFDGLRLAYNRLLTFGVKKIPESINDGPGIKWNDLCYYMFGYFWLYVIYFFFNQLFVDNFKRFLL